MTEITVFLPWPPSLNRLWRSGKGRVYKSAKYICWYTEADWAIKQLAGHPTIKGKFKAEIVLTPPDKRRIDLDNRIKAIFDVAEKCGLIENDSLCEHLTVQYDRVSIRPGAKLTLSEFAL
jgi:crossover junction endodeoxyribonuclease RusA